MGRSGVILLGGTLKRDIVPSKGGTNVVTSFETIFFCFESVVEKAMEYVPVGEDPKSSAGKLTRPVESEELQGLDMITSQGRAKEMPFNEFLTDSMSGLSHSRTKELLGGATTE